MIDYMMELIRFRELAVLKDDVQVVKKGLDFLRYIGDEYMRLEFFFRQEGGVWKSGNTCSKYKLFPLCGLDE